MFHIGLYTALATIVAAVLAINGTAAQPIFELNATLILAIGSICLAGFAGGEIASSIPGYEGSDSFGALDMGNGAVVG